MSFNSTSANDSITPRLVLVSTVLGVALLCTLALCVWWAIQRIDARTLETEKASLQSALNEEMRLVGVEQDSSAEWDDAVTATRQRDQVWIADNLVDWISDFFDHDRVYLIDPHMRVVRAAARGKYAGTTFDPSDVGVLLPHLSDLRNTMAQASIGLRDSTSAIGNLEVSATARWPNGDIAFVRARPLVPDSPSVLQAPGDEFLLLSVKFIDQEMLDGISERLGILGLRRLEYPRGDASIALRAPDGHAIAFFGWLPSHPAAGLLIETAPASIAILVTGASSLLLLLAWVRATAFKLAKSREQATYFALHDPLTGAANRILFDRKLNEAIGYEYLAKAKVLLVAIDIDYFKEINDTLGHGAGDQLLRQVTKRLMSELPEEATLGRLGGDEFAIVQPGVISEGQALWICQRLASSLQQPFQLNASPLQITFSLGVALEDGAVTPPSEILRRADVALYAAKDDGRNCVRFYDPKMDQSRHEKRSLEVELRNALVSGTGLHVVYQPIFSADKRELTGAEALVRWRHPSRGQIAPDQFIGLAEETGIIDQLGLWVLEEACKAAVLHDLSSIAVNVSPVQFRNRLLKEDVLGVLHRTGLAASRLEIEITEGLLLQNSPLVQETLATLREAGVKIALDDFGTGYSSISYLRSYPIDRLKIDQSFTRTVTSDVTTGRLVRSIIDMADALGMLVTAEGVEEEAQAQMLSEMGCSHLQGYLLSRPLSPKNLGLLLLGAQPERTKRLSA